MPGILPFSFDLSSLPFFDNRKVGGLLLGIDLRVASVKVVEAKKNNGSYEVLNTGLTEVPYQLLDKHPELEDAKADALQKLLQANNIKAREATVVVAGSETLIKKITLSELPSEEVSSAIKWKLLEELTYPIEEALIGYYPLTKSEAFIGKVDYVAACLHRKFYLQIQYILSKAGLKLSGLTILPDALQEIYRPDLIKGGEKIASIIYMGKHTTNISIFKEGQFEFNRELQIGGENITRAMSGIMISPEGRIEVSREEAERIKTEYGVPIQLENFPKIGEIPLSQLQAMVRPALEKVQNEVARTFEYYKGQSGETAINKILLTGGTSLTANLKEFLTEGLGTPVSSPEAYPKLNPRLTAALGAALVDGRRINLLPEEIKYRWKILTNKIFQPQVFIPGFSALLVVLFLLVWLRFFILNFELGRANNKLTQLQPALNRFAAIEKATAAEERRKITSKAFELSRSRMPAVFEEISRLVPEPVSLTKLNLTPAEVQLSGLVFNSPGESAEAALSRFVLGLSVSPLFEEVKLVQAVKNSDYLTVAFNFEITAKIRSK